MYPLYSGYKDLCIFPDKLPIVMVSFLFSCLAHSHSSSLPGFCAYYLLQNLLFYCWAAWVMPVIPALRETKAGRSLEVRSLRSAWPTWGDPISTKNMKKKLAGCGGG